MEEEAKAGKKTTDLAMVDAEQNKVIGILAYFIFFLPLLTAKDSSFAMYHANQGLVLLLLAIGINIVGTIIPILGWLVILPLGNLLIFILLVMGIVNAAKGLKKDLPIIGHYKIL